MKILHTSDWHIGRALYGRKRYDEFAAFFNWLLITLKKEQIDVLLVAGDIFDTTTPTHRAQQLYYQFLCHVAHSPCHHVVIIAGNHDSPSFLNAPKELLTILNVHVVSHAYNDDEQVIVLSNRDGLPELIVCATPYLRDSDIRISNPGESLADKEHHLVAGITTHYARIINYAKEKKAQLQADIPIVVMGHLFTTDGQIIDGDGVRNLYVGSLAPITARMFLDEIDYVALGHLHIPQKVMNLEWIRYSGSPIAMGFGEATHIKSVCIVNLTQSSTTKRTIQLVAVPVFQTLIRIKGSTTTIIDKINHLKKTHPHAWLEIIYEGTDSITQLRESLEGILLDSQLDILRINNPRLTAQTLTKLHPDDMLADLSHQDVFERCLIAHNIAKEQRHSLQQLYKEVLVNLYQQDSCAE
jgi:exonuclease SbcD